jgi:hypothetical protein
MWLKYLCYCIKKKYSQLFLFHNVNQTELNHGLLIRCLPLYHWYQMQAGHWLKRAAAEFSPIPVHLKCSPEINVNKIIETIVQT